MKIHITNLYNFNPDDELVKKQHRIAEAGRKLGYREMGIFSFPVETDSSAELSKRLDGIIAALESDDVVVLQLPTGNGAVYEKLLAQKCSAYRNTKLIIMLHDMSLLEASNESQAAYCEICRRADAVIVPTNRDVVRLKAIGVSTTIQLNDVQPTDDKLLSENVGYNDLCKLDFYVQKALIDAVEAVFAPQDQLFHAGLQKIDDEIQIGFGLHDKTGDYSVWVGVAIQSIIESTNAPICFHVLHDETLNADNKKKLIQTAIQKGNRIRFHMMDQSMWESTREQMAVYTIGALFRVMLPTCLPEISKVIYLDADILVNRDIKELWDIDITDYCLAAVQDADVASGLVKPVVVQSGEVHPERYFNSGVLYLNLDRIRQKGDMCKMILDYLQLIPKSDLPDQDALNVIYGSQTRLVDQTWNSFVRPIRNIEKRELENRVYHFVGTWCVLYSLLGVDWYFYEVLRRSPWGMHAAKTILSRSLVRVNYRSKQYEKLVEQLSDFHKIHVFYGAETPAMRNMYNILTIREGDYRILGEEEEKEKSVLPCRLVEALQKETDEFIVFVLEEADHNKAIEQLENLGLIKEKDYFIIPCLLPAKQGGYV